VLDSTGCVPTSGPGSAATNDLMIVPDGTSIVLNVQSRFVAGAAQDVSWDVFFATDGLTQNAPASEQLTLPLS
jgi:hypothetical protein